MFFDQKELSIMAMWDVEGAIPLQFHSYDLLNTRRDVGIPPYNTYFFSGFKPSLMVIIHYNVHMDLLNSNKFRKYHSNILLSSYSNYNNHNSSHKRYAHYHMHYSYSSRCNTKLHNQNNSKLA